MTMIRCPECGHEIDIDEILVDAAKRKVMEEFREDLNRVKEETEKQALKRYKQDLESEKERINRQKEGEMAGLVARNKAMEDANNDLRQQIGTLLSTLEGLKEDMKNSRSRRSSRSPKRRSRLELRRGQKRTRGGV